jgi:hypothetical protein
MVKETKDRLVNTDSKIKNDGVKRLPHERDESPDGQDKEPRGIIKQAAEDLARGLVDTDMHGMRGAEELVPDKGQSGQQANPLPDAAGSMRQRTTAIPPKGK